MTIQLTSNRLSKEKSPYLLQHQYNPVDWFPWGDEAFKKAKTEDKPIFLSIGYSTCHWCHVMEHESFENSEVAEILNRNFVSIKVDREERPDIDAVYMNVCQSMTGSGGWPLTILMTADQKPFFAATYLPRNSRQGTVGIIELLNEVARQWKTNRKELISVGEEIHEFLQKQHDFHVNNTLPSKNLIIRAVNDFKSYYDPVYGGFGIAPKFPAPHNLLFLMQYSEIEKDKICMEISEKALAQMYKGGIFDHIGGGFSRYSTDRKWLIPHFEKMLYDNALLTLAYLEAYKMSHKQLWERIIQKTLNYVLSEMTHPNGGFYCAQDADSDGEEGKYYSFTPDEIGHILGNDSEFFCKWFGITKEGNFEGKSIPNLIENPDWENMNERIEEDCKKVYAYRLSRVAVHKDDKILTSWNALMIAAFAKAGYLLHEPKYVLAAEKANTFISEKLMSKGHLFARWRDGESAYDGKLDDYAFYAFALLELYEATFKPEYLQKSIDTADQMVYQFFDSANGGFYFYGSDSEALIDRPKELYDGAMPSGNAVAAYVLARLGKLTGDVKWMDASDKQMRFLAGMINEHPTGYSFSLLAMMQVLYPSSELLCVTSENKTPPELFKIYQTLPNVSVLVKTPQNKMILENAAPFTKEYPISENKTAYYYCQNGTCVRPVYNIEDLYSLILQQQ